MGLSRQLSSGDDGGTDFYSIENSMFPVRWSAPEVLRERQAGPASDIYALAMTYYELYANAYPFNELEYNADVQVAVLSGERPRIPDTMPVELARLVQDCWQQKPEDRPSIVEVVRRIGHMLGDDSSASSDLDSISALSNEYAHDEPRMYEHQITH
jgi:Protein tyrosine and serine/threonine kinase